MAKEVMDLVGMLSKAGESDLAAIEKRIMELRAEVEQFVSSRRDELGALVLIRKSLQFKLHGKPVRKQSVPGKLATCGKQPSELATQIFDLLTEEGPMPVPAIAARLGVPGNRVAPLVTRSAWFERKNGEVLIAVQE